MRRRALAATAVVVLLPVGATAGGIEKTRVVLTPARLAPSIGRPWAAVVVVTGARPRTLRLTATSGRRTAGAKARHWRGNRYRARLVFRSAGRWTLAAHIGRDRFRLGAVRVRPVSPPPLLFAYPTQVAFQRNGALLLVENGLGRVARIHPATGRQSTFAQVTRPFGIAVGSSGDVYVSDANTVRRIDTARRVTTVAQADSDVGPLAIDTAGNVFFSTASRIFRIDGGTGPVTHYAGTGVEGGGGDGGPAQQAQLSGPHGLAVGTDGALYVSDTDNDRIRRIDARSRVIAAFAPAAAPGGLAVGRDGTLYVTEFETHRVLRIDRAGNASVVAGTGVRGSTGDGASATRARLTLPAAVAAAADGTLYIVESGAAGRIRRVDPSGTISTLRRR